MSIKGVSEVTRNLNKEIAKIKGGLKKGLMVAALAVKRSSQQKTPVDEGNLRAGAFTETIELPKGPRATIGYVAEYAPWVHEATGKLKGRPRPRKKGSSADRGKFWDPQGKAEPKFLEKALRENEKKILDIIQKHAKV